MNEKKIGLLTLYNSDNYGAMFQGYALQESIKRNGYRCEIIQHNRFGSSISSANRYRGISGAIKGLAKFLTSPGYAMLAFRPFIKRLKIEKRIQLKNCTVFREKMFQNRSKVFYYTDEHIRKDPPQYDGYVCGSDMIWSPERIKNGGPFFLDFVPDNRTRIAYAPSIASESIPKELIPEYKNYISKFQAVSVREKDSCPSLSEITGRSILQAMDPAFLLSKEEWNKLISDKKPIEEKIIFCYFLGERNFFNISAKVKKLAKAIGARIAILPAGRHMIKDVYMIEEPGPLAFLRLMRDASYVVTDSFHGTVFAMIYQKQFAVFRSKTTKVDGPFFRMDNLLRQFNLQNRIVCEGMNLPTDSIDYLVLDSLLNTEIARSKDFLKNALEQVEKQNMVRPSLATEESCTGCSACVSACNHQAITMKKNEAGFWYPIIDTDKCIECGLCAMHCPVRFDFIPADGIIPSYYMAFAKDKKKRLQGSSGNVFRVLSETVLSNGGVVFGAAFKDDNVRILCHQNTDEVSLQKIQKSKYCECEMGNIILQIEAKLSEKREVFFCGTPCQVAALRSAIPANDSLYLCDFICHGVPSIDWFGKYIDAIESKYQSKVKNIDFRDKTLGWIPKWTKISLENGKTIISSNCTDAYSIDFSRNMHLRKSCYGCNRILISSADITIGDYWAAKHFGKTDGTNEGISIIRINTEKGESLFNRTHGEELFSQKLADTEIQETFRLRGRNLPKGVDTYPESFPMKPKMKLNERMMSIYFDGFIKAKRSFQKKTYS